VLTVAGVYKMLTKMTLVVQPWEESERGWGIRPDGYSIHLNETDRKRFVKEYWEEQPDYVPDEYSRPSGNPYLQDFLVDDETLARLVVRFGNWEYNLDRNGLKRA
jgi:hypothetical protein